MDLDEGFQKTMIKYLGKEYDISEVTAPSILGVLKLVLTRVLKPLPMLGLPFIPGQHPRMLRTANCSYLFHHLTTYCSGCRICIE